MKKLTTRNAQSVFIGYVRSVECFKHLSRICAGEEPSDRLARWLALNLFFDMGTDDALSEPYLGPVVDNDYWDEYSSELSAVCIDIS